MRAFRTKTGGPWCWHCHHDLMALPRHGLCPECGNPYNAEEPPPPTLRQRLNEMPRDLSVAVVNAAPWFAEKYLPTSRTWARLIAVGGHSALVIGIGSVIFRSLGGRWPWQ